MHAEYGRKIKNMFFIERETLCDSAVTDQAFDIHGLILTAESDNLMRLCGWRIPSSYTIKIVLPKHIVLIMRMINLIRDNFKHGRHYAGKT